MTEESEINLGAVPEAAPEPVDPAWVGIKGWLLFLCIALTIIGPLANLTQLVKAIDTMDGVGNYGNLKMVMTLDVIFGFGLIALSLYAGVRLWTIRRGAVKSARMFFFCVLAYQGWAFFGPLLLMGGSGRFNEKYIELILPKVIGGLAAVAIWLSYLKRSRRVKATFPQE